MSKKEQIIKLLEQGEKPSAVAKKLKASEAYVYSLKRELNKAEAPKLFPVEGDYKPIVLDYGKTPKEISVKIDLETQTVTMPFSEFQEFLKYWKVAA